jgi:hypothetical protein
LGYCISVSDINVQIKKENHPAALKAIQSLHGEETIKDGSGRHFSWVDNEFYKINDLLTMLGEWRWYAKIDENGDLKIVDFTGEKYGDDKHLFNAIAPYIEPGGSITFRGEDNARWKYLFDGKTMTEKKAKITIEWD